MFLCRCVYFNVPRHERVLNAPPPVRSGATQGTLEQTSLDQPIKPAEVAAFWREAGPKAWFARDAAFDQTVRQRLEPAHLVASRGELGAWADGPEGALALLILLDQAPRNIYRGSAHAFASDPLARAAARLALAHRWDQGVEPLMRPFFYLPFDHSESKEDQDFSVALSEAHRDATIDFRCSFLVVSSGNPWARSNRICRPNVPSVPVPVRSSRLTPAASRSANRSRYWRSGWTGPGSAGRRRTRVLMRTLIVGRISRPAKGQPANPPSSRKACSSGVVARPPGWRWRTAGIRAWSR